MRGAGRCGRGWRWRRARRPSRGDVVPGFHAEAGRLDEGAQISGGGRRKLVDASAPT